MRRLYVIHELRWQLGNMRPEANDEENDKYYNANEFLNESEKKPYKEDGGQKGASKEMLLLLT